MSLHRPVVALSWSKKVIQDHYFKEAKRLGYVSRAAFKLKQIQEKHKIIKPGGHVLDLGCSPGAWLQVACQELGPRKKGGCVMGLDLQEVTVPKSFCDDRVTAIQADARTVRPEVLLQYAPQGYDTVLSDMLHFTSGVNDVELSLDLAATALHIATGCYYDLYGDAYAQRMGFRHAGLLKPGGAIAIKVYEGSGTSDFIKLMQGYFTKVARMRVDASRSMSREFYAVGLGRKKPQEKAAGAAAVAASPAEPGAQQQQQQQQPSAPAAA